MFNFIKEGRIGRLKFIVSFFSLLFIQTAIGLFVFVTVVGFWTGDGPYTASSTPPLFYIATTLLYVVFGFWYVRLMFLRARDAKILSKIYLSVLIYFLIVFCLQPLLDFLLWPYYGLHTKLITTAEFSLFYIPFVASPLILMFFPSKV